MKNSLLFSLIIGTCIFLLPEKASGTHLAGGSITYEYVGDSTGTPYEYCITLVLYRREQGVALGNTQSVNIKSSCFPNSILTLPYAPGVIQGATPRGDTNCIDQNDPGYAQGKIEEYVYSTCTVLPGECADYTFSWRQCCRNGNITNLQNPSTSSFYLESKLNNTIGPNTSPSFLNPGAKFFCVGQPFTWSQAASEPDQDSLYYTLAQPWDDENVPIPWAPGFSTLQPMTTIGGFNLNNQTGVFNFTPAQPEVDVIKIIVEEYRWDSVQVQFLLVGTSIREMQIPVLASCNPIATSGISITQGNTVGNVTSGTVILNGDSLINRFKVDSIADFGGGYTAIDYMGYECFDTILTVKVNGNLNCSSIATDGSDFRLIGPDGISRPIVRSIRNCQSTLLTDKIDLVLHKPLDVNGDYLLQIKKGNDGNTITNECGYGVKEFFSSIVRVDNCPKLEYKVTNVSVEYDQVVKVDWKLTPGTYTIQNEELWTSWNVMRAKAGDPNFYLLESLSDPTDLFTRSYIDSTLSMYELDRSSFDYRIQLVQNFSYLPPTDKVSSILLTENILQNNTGYEFSWSKYDAWDSPQYELFMARVDTASGSHPWNSVAGPDPQLLSWNWQLPNPLSAADRGIYAFKVEAIDGLNPQNQDSSESNWVYIELWQKDEVEFEPTSAVVPNIFSPNGDDVNDYFFVSGTKGYTSASIVVYNRWGKEVFKEDANKPRLEDQALRWDGRDVETSELLSDGVYYYVLNLSDHISGTQTQLKGQVSILKN